MRIWLVTTALDSVESRMNCADNNHATGLWNSLLDASRYRVDSRLVTIDGLGMLLMFFYQVLAFSSLVGGLRHVLTRDQMTTFLFLVSSSVVHLDVFLVISYMPTHVVDTSLHQAIDRSRRHHTLQFTHMSHRS